MQNATQKLILFVRQSPGLESGNYDPRSFRAESRRIAQQKTDFFALLGALSAISNDVDAELRADGNGTGRLTWDTNSSRWDYCTGQYFCIEFRAAACRLIADAIWRLTWGKDENAMYAKRADVARMVGRSVAARWLQFPEAPKAVRGCVDAGADLRANCAANVA
jgi:hypothetical protein